MSYSVARRSYRQALAHVRLIRPNAFIDVAILFILGYIFAGGPLEKGAIFLHVFLSLLMLAFAHSFSNTINDIYDLDLDLFNNRSDRPLATLDLSLKTAVFMAYFYALVSLILGAILGQNFTIVTIALLCIAVAYSHPHISLSHQGLYGTMALSLSYFVLPLYCALLAASATWNTETIILLFGLSCIGLGRLFLKDYRDIQENRRTGKNTPSVTVGIKNLRRIALSLGIIGTLAIYFVMINDSRFTHTETDLGVLVVLFSVALAYWAGRIMDNKNLQNKIVLFSYLANRLAILALIYFLVY